MRKTAPVQILLAMEKILNVDMHDFRWKLVTGRLWHEYDIMITLGCNTLAEVYIELGRYSATYRGMLLSTSIKELTQKGWLTNTAISRAKRIKRIYQTETLILK